MKNEFLFQVWPYLALAILGLGFIVRYAVASQRGAPRLAAELARARALFGGGVIWRASLLLLLLAHLVGLLLPQRLLTWDSVPVRLYLLEGAGFLVGLLVLAGWARLMSRQLARSKAPVGAEVADSLFLSLCFLGVSSGLLTAALYRWGAEWGTATLTPYTLSILQGAPRAGLIASLPFLVKLHVASAFGALALLPFSGVAPFVIAAVQRVLGWVGRPLAGGSRSAEGWFRKHNPSAWIWPEED
jgi:nitrate reductase gamma subunit